MVTQESAIGMIDSGIGGFSVARMVQRRLPNENLIYIGDGANTPYGNRTAEEILRLTRYMLGFMEEKGVKTILVACNTISSLIEQYRNETSCPVVSVVQAGVEAVAELDVERVGVISTGFTHSTGCYPKLIGKVSPEKTVISRSCPNLANLVEQDFRSPQVQEMIDVELEENLGALIAQHNIQCCVLGCTHYPLVEERIKGLYPNMPFIDPALQMAKTVEEYLASAGLLNPRAQQGTLDIYTTKGVEKYGRRSAMAGLNPVTSVQFYPPFQQNRT